MANLLIDKLLMVYSVLPITVRDWLMDMVNKTSSLYPSKLTAQKIPPMAGFMKVRSVKIAN